jgi:hypothetical protein
MDPLPMAPSCALDEAGLRLQHERYRQAGVGARVVDRAQRGLVIDLDEHVDRELVDELVAVEKECCPFFALRWDPGTRRLAISVSLEEHEPAIDAIAFALRLEGSLPHAAPS